MVENLDVEESVVQKYLRYEHSNDWHSEHNVEYLELVLVEEEV